MKSKRSILLCLALVLSMAMAMGTTLAYLQDSDSDVNVMTLGNVYIDQIEEFEQGTAIYPNTEVEKKVTVKNTGKSDAYFRTLIAIENLPESETFEVGIDVISIMKHYTSYFESTEWEGWPGGIDFELDGKHYELWVVTYNKVLAPGEISEPSLLKVELGKTCTNEDMAALGDTLDILVLSQAVQTAGFDDAQTALDEAFGPVTVEKAKEWFSGEDFAIPTIVSSAEELAAALEAGGNILLGADIEWTMDADLEQSKEVILDLNGKTLTVPNTYSNPGWKNWNVRAPLTVEDSVGGGRIEYKGHFNLYAHMTHTGGTINLNTINSLMICTGGGYTINGENAMVYCANNAALNVAPPYEIDAVTVNIMAGTIKGFHGISGTQMNRPVMLNISGGQIIGTSQQNGVGISINNLDVVTISGSPVIEGGSKDINMTGGTLDMSGLTGEGEYTITKTGGEFIAPSADAWNVSDVNTSPIHITPQMN